MTQSSADGEVPKGPGWSEHRFWLVLIGIAALAAVVHVAYVFSDGRALIGGDGFQYSYDAVRLAEGHGFTTAAGGVTRATANHPPAWTVVLSGITWLGGRGALAHQFDGGLLRPCDSRARRTERAPLFQRPSGARRCAPGRRLPRLLAARRKRALGAACARPARAAHSSRRRSPTATDLRSFGGDRTRRRSPDADAVGAARGGRDRRRPDGARDRSAHDPPADRTARRRRGHRGRGPCTLDDVQLDAVQGAGAVDDR